MPGALLVAVLVCSPLVVLGFQRRLRRRKRDKQKEHGKMIAQRIALQQHGDHKLVEVPETVRRVLITGSNSGLGLDTARWLAENYPDTTEIILAVRSQAKGEAAIQELVKLTGRPAQLFSVLVVSIGDIPEARAAASKVTGQVDGLVLNAGGMSGGTSMQEASGALAMFAINTLGHAAFLEELIRLDKISQNAHVVLVGSFAARGMTSMGLPFPEFPGSTVEDVVSLINGKAIKPLAPEPIYGYAKSVMALYAAAMARRHPQFSFYTVSPGCTTGTKGSQHAPLWIRFMLNVVGPLVMIPLGMMHALEVGTGRYVEALLGTRFPSGAFLGSTKDKMSGEMFDQSEFYPMYADEKYQEAAYEAVHRFI